jgi:hypothetical protein
VPLDSDSTITIGPSFGTHQVERILGVRRQLHAGKDLQLMFFVKWYVWCSGGDSSQERRMLIVATVFRKGINVGSFIPNYEMKVREPQLVIEFYESRLRV